MTSSTAAREVPPQPDSTRGTVDVRAWRTTASWQKSRASSEGANCVHVNVSWAHVWIRDSKNPDGPVLGLTRQDWTVFLGAVRRGEFTGAGLPV
jgi:Domain of unknown function (DUF397)